MSPSPSTPLGRAWTSGTWSLTLPGHGHFHPKTGGKCLDCRAHCFTPIICLKQRISEALERHHAVHAVLGPLPGPSMEKPGHFPSGARGLMSSGIGAYAIGRHFIKHYPVPLANCFKPVSLSSRPAREHLKAMDHCFNSLWSSEHLTNGSFHINWLAKLSIISVNLTLPGQRGLLRAFSTRRKFRIMSPISESLITFSK